MTVSLFPSLLCLALFKQDSGLFCLSIERDSIPQDVINAQITGVVSFLIAETGVRKKNSASSLLHDGGEAAEFKASKKLEFKLILGEAGMALV